MKQFICLALIIAIMAPVSVSAITLTATSSMAIRQVNSDLSVRLLNLSNYYAREQMLRTQLALILPVINQQLLAIGRMPMATEAERAKVAAALTSMSSIISTVNQIVTSMNLQRDRDVNILREIVLKYSQLIQILRS